LGIAAWAWTAGTTAAYTIAALVLFHGVLGDLDDRAPLNGTGDVAQMAWFQSWTAWAIAHVHDPFVSHAINAPHGVNLMWNTAMPLAGAVMAPITLAFGPLTTVNVLFILGPITTALTARWWLGRHVESELARSVGGAVVGFGPFVAAHLGGHLNFTVLTLVPVLLRLGEDVLWRAPGRRLPAILLGFTIAGQALLSEEVLLLVIGGAIVMWLAAVTCVPSVRRWPSAVAARGFGLTAVVAGAVLAWPLAIQLLGPDRSRGVDTARYFAQPRDLVIPSTHEFFGTSTESQTLVARGSNPFEDAVYLGVPALLLLVLTVAVYRRQRWLWTGVLAGIVFVLFSFGAGAHGAIWTGIAHPFAPLLAPPVLSSIVPQRFGLLLDLLAAWWVAHLVDTGLAGLASLRAARDRMAHWLVPIATLALVAIVLVSWVPAPPVAQTNAHVPAFFTSTENHLLRNGSRVILLPAPDQSDDAAMLDQADTSLRFSMLGSYAISIDANGKMSSHASADPLTVAAKQPTATVHHEAVAIRQRIKTAGVTAIMLVPGPDTGGLLSVVRAVYGSPTETVGGVDVWQLDRS
jgi:hypothetical protein